MDVNVTIKWSPEQEIRIIGLLERLMLGQSKIERLIMGSQAELTQAINDFRTSQEQSLNELKDQLNKALQEIIQEVQNIGNVTPELQAAFDNMKQAIETGVTASKEVSQQLDDLNPDVPPPPP